MPRPDQKSWSGGGGGSEHPCYRVRNCTDEGMGTCTFGTQRMMPRGLSKESRNDSTEGHKPSSTSFLLRALFLLSPSVHAPTRPASDSHCPIHMYHKLLVPFLTPQGMHTLSSLCHQTNPRTGCCESHVLFSWYKLLPSEF